MQYINPPTIEEFTKNLKKKFGDKFIVNSKCESGTWQTKRHIQVYPKGRCDLHYEYRIDHNWDGRIELHFESDTEDKYNALIDNLINLTQNDEKLRDCFGNLVMISQGLNSSLQNESYEVKREHVKAYCNDSKSGSIESLKLLVAYKDHPDGWTIEKIKEHGEKMYELLKEAVQTDIKK